MHKHATVSLRKGEQLPATSISILMKYMKNLVGYLWPEKKDMNEMKPNTLSEGQSTSQIQPQKSLLKQIREDET